MDHCKTAWKHSLALEAEPFSVGRARDFVRAELTSHELPHLVDDVLLVTSELATNAVCHGGSSFAVCLERAGHRLVLSVHDASYVRPEISAGDALAVGGRGLMIVAQLSNDWGVEDSALGVKSVWADFETARTMAPDW